MRRSLVLLSIPLTLGGCGTLVDAATAPVKAVSKVADWATVSQDEADRERGREIRRREERLGKLHRDCEDAREDCLNGSDRACRRAVELERQIDALLPTIPVEPES
ncbi:MAG: hypothetical protein WBA68_05900 [Alteraurantiacibacter sp.]